MIFSVLVTMFAASVYCVVAKEMYKSSTTILITPQKIPEEYIKSTVTYRIEERLNTIQQQVLSRTRLLNVIKTHGLFPELQGKVPQEEIVEMMRERINLELKGDQRERKTAFAIEYSHEDPQTAMLVTSSLASMFIEKNLNIREQQAMGTAEFIDNQLEQVKEELDIKDRKIKVFRTKYLGELPEQLTSNLGMLSRYQDELKSNAEYFRAAQDRRILLDTQIADLKAKSGYVEIAAAEKENETTVNGFDRWGVPTQSMDQEMAVGAIIAEKEAELARLRLRYTENHPAIGKVQHEIMRLQAKARELRERAKTPGTKGRKNGGAGSAAGGPSPIAAYVSPRKEKMHDQIRALIDQRNRVELEIKSLKEEKENILKLIELYSRRVENTPKRELELKELTRDYNSLLRTHEELLGKKINADMSQDLESRQKGEQFQIIDPAYLPEKPYKPNRAKMLLVAFVLSVSIGGWGAILLERFDKSIKTPGEFSEVFELPVLASLPEVVGDAEEMKMFRKKALLAGGLAVYAGAVLLFIFLYFDKIKVIFKA